MPPSRRLLLPAFLAIASGSQARGQTLYGNLSVSDAPVLIASEGYANTVAVASASSSPPASLTVTAAFTNQLPGGTRVGHSTDTHGVVQVAGAGASWTDTGSLIVGGTGAGVFTVSDGASVTAASASLGDARTFSAPTRRGDGALSLSGGSALALAGALYVGNQGAGAFTLASGSTATSSSAVIARNAGSSGSAILSGALTSWTNSGDLTVGQSGAATLRVEAGASLANAHARLGLNPGASGTATVTGLGSRWISTGTLVVGNNGDDQSRLDILDSARVEAATVSVHRDDTLFVGAGSVLQAASVTVNPAGLLAGDGTVDGDVLLSGGVLAPGDKGGRLTINGALGLDAASLLVLELSSSGPSNALSVGGHFSVGGTLLVSFPDNGPLLAGTNFDVFDFSSIGGTFASLELPDLGGTGLRWDTSRLYLDGTLSIAAIPEPAVAATLAGALGGVLTQMRRHRRRSRARAR